MNSHSSKYDPCVCGNLDEKGKPVFYSKCCGDKPDKNKMYFDKSLPDFINSNFQLIDPFLTTNPAFKGQLEFQVRTCNNFRILTDKQLRLLFSKGIPVYNPESYFSFAFLKMNRYLSSTVNKEKYFTILFEILHNEVQMAIAKSLFRGVFLARRETIDSQLRTNSARFAEVVFRETGEVKNVEENLKTITSIDYMKARWVLDDCVFRIRSQWDKLLYLLSKGYFGFSIESQKFRFDIKQGKLGELRSKSTCNGVQRDFLHAFCTLALETFELKRYRDNLSHTVSNKIQNCLGGHVGKEVKTVDDLWELVRTQHGLVQEATLCAIGITAFGD